jgi:hypothetical protein
MDAASRAPFRARRVLSTALALALVGLIPLAVQQTTVRVWDMEGREEYVEQEWSLTTPLHAVGEWLDGSQPVWLAALNLALWLVLAFGIGRLFEAVIAILQRRPGTPPRG